MNTLLRTLIKASLITILGLINCGPADRSEWVTVSLQLPDPHGHPEYNLASRFIPTPPLPLPPPPPPTISGFDCYGLNVTGSGIPYQDWSQTLAATSTFTWLSLLYRQGQGCSNWPAATSALASPAQQTSISMTVPAGLGRTISVIGLKMRPGTTCPTNQNLSSVPAQFQDQSMPTMLLLGSATTDLVVDSTVNITNSYNPQTPTPAFRCNTPRYFLYGDWSNMISAHQWNPQSGTLTPIAGGAITGIFSTAADNLASHPSGQSIFWVDNAGILIHGFTINSSTGALSALGAAFPSNSPSAGIVSSDGTTFFTYISSLGFSEFPLFQNGMANNPTNTVSLASSAVQRISLSPNGATAYIGSGIAQSMNAVTLSTLSVTTSLGCSSFSCPQWVADPSGHFLFGVRGNTAAGVEVYGITNSSTGAFNTSVLQGIPFNPYVGKTIALDPFGRFAFVVTSGNQLVTLPISRSGPLPFSAGITSSINLNGTAAWMINEPSGRYLFVMDSIPSQYEIFSYDLNGNLSAVGNPISVPGASTGVDLTLVTLP